MSDGVVVVGIDVSNNLSFSYLHVVVCCCCCCKWYCNPNNPVVISFRKRMYKQSMICIDSFIGHCWHQQKRQSCSSSSSSRRRSRSRSRSRSSHSRSRSNDGTIVCDTHYNFMHHICCVSIFFTCLLEGCRPPYDLVVILAGEPSELIDANNKGNYYWW